VSVLDESLHRVLTTDGASGAALIDVGTGMVVRSAGDVAVGLPAAAAAMADEARSATWSLGPAQPGGDLEEVAVLTAGRFHLLRLLEFRRGEGLLLFVDFDRSLTNFALATLQVAQIAPALLA
jgi:hypothetical protein